ncbi:CinA family protein [Microbacterium ulmi]|uniref:CinA family protein n=1 Tax=Microbacterium ulmi TaxID=179095 RepID=A0A7Y2Q1B1_9MICO|nr:CinA family protein [Microbacterium ulmi]NII70607.1 nicotinamide-nucleotide amidase [Microbacterium ulmi]NNH04152.1 CinA family protein [Microbacterium ulmi]
MTPLKPHAPDFPDDADITQPSSRRADAESATPFAPAVDAVRLLERLGELAWTVGVAESLTGGLVIASLIGVPGASSVVRGGVVAYATEVKHTMLGVDETLLQAHGAVHPRVARQMADGVRARLGVDGTPCDVGIATTGIAGPDSPDGQPVGTVHIAVATPLGTRVESLELAGTRDEIRTEAVRRALRLALDAL